MGKILFNDTRFVRQPFSLTRIVQDSKFAQAWDAATDLVGRRSVFTYADSQLLVAEVFFAIITSVRKRLMMRLLQGDFG